MINFNWAKRASGIFLLWAAGAVVLPAQTLTTLHSFDIADGYYPVAALVQGTNGNFYGTTYLGGANSGGGTIFKITPSGTLTTVYNFGTHSGDGISPTAALVQGNDGNFYGTTSQGGTQNSAGTVFKITANGTLTTLYNFCSVNQQGSCVDGVGPLGGLVLAANGEFYGTTYAGGLVGYDQGTVFKITPSGTLTTIYRFCSQPNCADGAAPKRRLIQAANGNFYGTTNRGGANGEGTVFKISPSGTLTTLHNFRSHRAATAQPTPLLQATDGNFYGTTYAGGKTNCVRLWHGLQDHSGGALTTLYNFCRKHARTAQALRGWSRAPMGTFTEQRTAAGQRHTGRSSNHAKRNVDNVLQLLSQRRWRGQYHPAAALVQGTSGTFYGTTAA